MVTEQIRCVIISASPEYDTDFIREYIRSDDYIICADGGLNRLISIGIEPDLIVGDFDSSENFDYFKHTEIIRLQVQKDDTDTMHSAQEAVRRGFRNLVFLGATGGRLDHTLANLSVLLYLQNNGASGVISDRYNDVMLLKQGRNVIHGVKGKTISVMPFASFTAELSYKGMYYPMTQKEVRADFPYTISNIAVEDTVEIFLHSGTALLITSCEKT